MPSFNDLYSALDFHVLLQHAPRAAAHVVLDDVAEAFLEGIDLVLIQTAGYEPVHYRKSWRGELPVGGPIQVDLSGDGLAFLITPAGWTRITHRASESEVAQAQYRSDMRRLARLYGEGTEREILETEAEHLVRTHDWYAEMSGDSEYRARARRHSERMKETLARLPYEVAERIYNHHKPERHYAYSREGHQAEVARVRTAA